MVFKKNYSVASQTERHAKYYRDAQTCNTFLVSSAVSHSAVLYTGCLCFLEGTTEITHSKSGHQVFRRVTKHNL